MASRSRTAAAILGTKTADETDVPEWARPESADQTPNGAASSNPDADAEAAGESAGGDAQAENVEGVVASRTPALDNLLEWLANEAVTDDEDSLAGLESIVREVLTATDGASVLRQRMPAAASQWLNVPLLWTGYTIRESDYDEGKGLPYYVSMQVMCGEPAEARVINCGGIKVLAQTKRFAELGAWPIVVMIVETAKAKKGQNAPLGLVAVPDAE